MFETCYFLLGTANSLLLTTIFLLVRYAKSSRVAAAGKVYLALAVPAGILIALAQQQQIPVQYTIFLSIFLVFLALEGIYDFVLKVSFRDNWKLLTPYLMLYWSLNYGFIVLAWRHSNVQGGFLLGLFVLQIIANIRSHTKETEK